MHLNFLCIDIQLITKLSAPGLLLSSLNRKVKHLPQATSRPTSNFGTTATTTSCWQTTPVQQATSAIQLQQLPPSLSLHAREATSSRRIHLTPEKPLHAVRLLPPSCHFKPKKPIHAGRPPHIGKATSGRRGSRRCCAGCGQVSGHV